MTWLVRVALERPLTFIVMAIMIVIFGPLAATRTPTDIFPVIGIPVIGVALTYGGLSPTEMAGRITSPFERALPNAVNDIDHIESQTSEANTVVKVFFQPPVNIAVANAQLVGVSQWALRSMPLSTQPAYVVDYNASSVPVLQLALSSKTLSEQQILDLASNNLRTQLVSVPGAAIPAPTGGKSRSIVVDLNPTAMQAR
jgi:multidrug efflux pump subunit AcrB